MCEMVRKVYGGGETLQDGDASLPNRSGTAWRREDAQRHIRKAP